MKPPSPQYIAGFFDGEGHVSKDGMICITQKDPSILLDIQAIYGGHMRIVNKIYHRLQLRVGERQKFLDEVGPYSRKIGGE
jgi:hypothetical protein